MSPLRGRKIRRIYINSEDNYNENALNKINNINGGMNHGNYDDNYRLSHFRKFSKYNNFNISEVNDIPLEITENHVKHRNNETIDNIFNSYGTNQGINVNNINKINDHFNNDAHMLDNSQGNDFCNKNLTPIQIKYLQKTQKLLSYELSNYKSGIRQLLSLPEYLPCDM